MNHRIEKARESFFDRIWLLLIIILIIYVFFFQYSVKSFSGLMIVLCSSIILCGLFQIFANQHGKISKSLMGLILFFVFVASLVTIIFTSQGNYGTMLCVKMIEYVLTAYSIYLLLLNQPQYIEILLGCICVTITLLGIVSLSQGVAITSAGAKGIEGLNANIMSSFFVIMIFSSFCLFWKKRRKIITILLCLMNAIVIIAQISAASRRGFIVIILFVSLSIIFALIPHKSGNRSKKRMTLYIFFVVAIAVALVYFKNYLLDSTVLGARLMGSFDGGDAARAKYQAFALEQFRMHPIWGIGLGGIAYHMGAYSHSMYYELVSCTGLVMTMIFFAGFLGFGVKYWKINKQYRRRGNCKEIVYVSTECFFFWLSLIISGYAVVMIYDFYFYLSVALLTKIYKNIELNGENWYL